MAKEQQRTEGTNRPDFQTADPEKAALLVLIQQLQNRLDGVEHGQRLQQEALLNSRTKIIDDAFEAWKREAARPAKERTQDIADARYGKDQPRFRVRLDSTTEEGRPGPRVAEHFDVELSASDSLHAQGRYLQLMGISKHDYKVVAEPIAA